MSDFWSLIEGTNLAKRMAAKERRGVLHDLEAHPTGDLLRKIIVRHDWKCEVGEGEERTGFFGCLGRCSNFAPLFLEHTCTHEFWYFLDSFWYLGLY